MAFYNDINFKAVDMKKKTRDSEFLGLANQFLVLVRCFGSIQQLMHFIQCQCRNCVILRAVLSMWQIKVIDIGSSKYYGLHFRSNYEITFDVAVANFNSSNA